MKFYDATTSVVRYLVRAVDRHICSLFNLHGYHFRCLPRHTGIADDTY